MSNIKSIKLITGEDVICEYIVDSNSNFVTLKNPVQVTMVPSRSGNQPNFGFIPFPLTSNDKEIKIKEENVLYICEPAEEFVTQYNTIFGSGIITPPQGLII